MYNQRHVPPALAGAVEPAHNLESDASSRERLTGTTDVTRVPFIRHSRDRFENRLP